MWRITIQINLITSFLSTQLYLVYNKLPTLKNNSFLVWIDSPSSLFFFFLFFFSKCIFNLHFLFIHFFLSFSVFLNFFLPCTNRYNFLFTKQTLFILSTNPLSKWYNFTIQSQTTKQSKAANNQPRIKTIGMARNMLIYWIE